MFKHLDKKYFSFRRETLDLAQRTYPDRAGLLAASENLRLLYIFFSAGICAAICLILTFTAANRVGLQDWRPFVFAVMAIYATYITGRVLWALTLGRGPKPTRQASER